MDSPRVVGYCLGLTTLLLFQRCETTANVSMGERGVIAGHGLGKEHDGIGLRTHFALALESRENVDVWENELMAKEVKILGKVDWPKGGKSIYFEDPDGHVGEFASKGIWPHY
jgi:catechol 2,3-dioxygenase-like lactoylglutathione lyase family enzyme